MRGLLVVLALFSTGLAHSDAAAGWDPLQKAERSALESARRFADGDSLGAVEAMLKAQALAPDDPRIRMGLAEALYNNGEYKTSLGQYEVAGEASEDYQTDALYNAGNAAFAMGDLERALGLYTKALTQGNADPDLLHNLELAQKLLEQKQEQQEQEGEEGKPQEGEEQQEQEGSQEQQQQQQEQQQEQQRDEEGQEQESEPQQQEGEGEEQEPQEDTQQPAQPDSLPPMPAMADSLAVPEGMTAEQAMRLLDALDHDEEELRRSIQRRLRRGDKESENDW